MAGTSLVIVESPTKARTIVKFLGKDFVVLASNGHVRDLPNSADEIPEAVKKEPWARWGVNVDDNFEALYIVPKSKKQHVNTLKAALKDADILYLATDEDREGESISWHLTQVLKPKIPIKRLVFHEITKEAIAEALASPRDVNEDLVRAQETRRIVDRLFGYNLSPILWKKIAPKLSAGRVQSVAIRLLVDREHERMKFLKASYWGLKGDFSKLTTKEGFQGQLTHVAEQRIATGKDFNPDTGELSKPKSVFVLTKEKATELQEKLKNETPRVTNVDEKPYTTRPSAPFVTSSLQQESNRKFRLSAKHTMSIAQRLYENGFITYMRTDSTTLSTQALNATRDLIKESYGAAYLPDSPRIYKTKVKNAQEAHEAIRPAGETFTPLEEVKKKLGAEAFKIYELIWKRTIASQMTDAKGKHISVSIMCADARFRASGKTIDFPGFLRAYVEGSDDPDADLADKEKLLPALSENESLNLDQINTQEHSTMPPARYTEGSLIKELEKRGIGRPSTWASVVDVVLARAYATKKANALIPSFTAFAVVNLLEKHFTYLLDYEFTARLEDDLDAISRGEAHNIDYLRSFYFGDKETGLKALVEEGEKSIDPREVCGIPIVTGENGKPSLEVRIGRYGPFLTDGTLRAGLTNEIAPDELTEEIARKILEDSNKEPETLGEHPETNQPIFLKTGRYGPYVQLGEKEEDGPKPKMASVPKTMNIEEVTLEVALRLLSLPRDLGEHPETKESIVAHDGRFGPYVKSGSDTRSIPADSNNPYDITLEQALELLSQPKQGRGGTKAKPIKELGEHPVSKAPVVVRSGRFGPYVTDGETNASIDKAANPEEVTLEQAVELLEARAAKGPPKKRKAKAKAKTKAKAKPKDTTKKTKTTAKKSTAKKTVTRKASTKTASKKESATKTE